MTTDYLTAKGKRHFESKIQKTETCWLWTGALNHNGYGHFGVFGWIERAHRVAYRHFIGPIPEGLNVLHSCDIRHCVNPAHLSVGSQYKNICDAIDKGRFLQKGPAPKNK